MGFHIPTEVLIIAWTAVAAVVLLMAVFARLYRKAGPNEALVVYGFRGTRVIKGHGTVILPMVENCRELSLELMSFDVAPQQDLYTKQGVAVTVEAVAQIKVKSDPESILTASEQFLTKTPPRPRGADPAGDGRPPARHHRPAHGGRDREAAGDGGRPHALHLRRRHEQDGPGGDLVHHQGSSRQERIHHQHGPAGRRAHQARRRRGHRRSRARHRHQARHRAARIGDRQGAGRPGARGGGDGFAGRAGRGATRSRGEEGDLRRVGEAPAGAGRQGVRDPDQRHAAAGDGRGGEDPAGGEGAAGQGAGSRNPAPRERADRHRAEGRRDRAPAHRDAGRSRAAAD